MMALRFWGVSAAALALTACEKEATFTEPLPSYAAIHWVNAVPDTNQQDMRVIDIVSNAGLFDANFRGSNMFYQPIEAGTRSIRIFLSSTDPAIASQVLHNGNLSLTAGTGYTFIHMGFARTGSTPTRQGILITDAPPTPAGNTVALRVINAGVGPAGGAVDIWFVKRPVNTATADSLPDTRSAAGVAFGAASAYVTVGTDTVAADSLRIIVTAAGTKTPILNAGGVNGVKAPVGAAGTTVANPIAGTRVRESVLTAVVVPPSVAGSQGTQGFTTPSALYLVDRRPPNTVPDP
jgi:uncharacterized protein DUF4397